MDAYQKNKIKIENRYAVLSQLKDDIIQDPLTDIYFSKHRCAEVLGGKPPKKKHKLRGIRCHFGKGKPFKSPDAKKHCKVPNKGPRPWGLPKSKKLGEFHKEKLLGELLELTKQTKNDFHKLKIASEHLVGTFINTRWVDIVALPYVSVHPGGFVFVHKTPSLRAARSLLSQCLHVPSTFLEKVSRLQCIFASYDVLGRFRHTNLAANLSWIKANLRIPSSNEGKSMAFE
jgi:hypothetical protein